MSEKFLLKIYKQPQTVFTLKDISLLFPDLSYQSLKNRIHYAIRSGGIKAVRRGIYVKEDYNALELANKIYTPSYISLETVLAEEDMLFQVYKTIFVVSYLTRRIKVAGNEIFYRKIKDSVLSNPAGVIEKQGYFQASRERAFLDAVFLYKDYHFDNLKPLDWDIVFNLQKIYKSKELEKRVKEYKND